MTEPRIAVLLPCYNEEAAIGQTVRDFRAALPEAVVYVYDNNSRDRTCEVAAAAGAVVRAERRQGKGAVVRRMFADIDADIYVMADGDATYEAAAAPRLVERLIGEQLDMVVGTRVTDARRRGRLSPGSPVRQQAADRAADADVRHVVQRHPDRLPRVLAPLRQKLPGPVGGVRDRDRDQHPRARARHAVRRAADRLFRPPDADRCRSCRPMPTAGASCGRWSRCTARSGRRCSSARSPSSCWRSRPSSRCRWRSPMPTPGWSRACRPRCSLPA